MTDDIRDPFAEEVDETDPFATEDDVKSGGKFEPSPFLDSLAGRLVFMVPRAFDAEAKKRADRIEPGGKETEEKYTVDMAVLDGGELRFWFNEKQAGTEERVPTEKIVPADELPKLYTGVWRTEGNIVGQLKKIDGSARPILLGRVQRGPQAKDKAKGATVETIGKAYAAWEKRGKNGPKPKFSWVIEVSSSDADKALARKAIAAFKGDGWSL